MPLSPGTTLGPYTITAELGHGGMGVVYTAQDPRLKRQVAIKLLPPELTRDETAKQRFLQEAQAASALDHPNICTIHEINETEDGQLYLVMAHYEGETLKERIERGALSVDEAVDIVTQVGQGLAEAHGAGIVHRDIKPANLLIATGGTVKILDFGLAKLAGTEGVTQTGSVVGTVAYMSPEQARGEEVDYRTDVWSLGVVLYEMLAGTPPFRGDNLLAISNAILDGTPSSLPGGSSSAQSVVTRALHKTQSQRYQAVGDLLGELRKATSPPTRAPGVPDVPSIAVLPFANMSADPEQEYFCEGLSEELIDALARLDGLRVVARTSAFQFRGKGHDLREVGDTLNVKTVLEGSVRKAGNRLRVNAQLINAEDGYHLWSERYDRDMDDVFEVQDDIARSVVDVLKVKLLGRADAPLVKPSTDNLEAYNLYLKGRFYWDQMPEGPQKAIQCFEQAIEKDPTYAPAYAGIADSYNVLGWFGVVAPRDAYPKAEAAARRALNLDDSLADAHASLGYFATFYAWDWGLARRELQRAVELNPNYSRAHLFSVYYFLSQGEWARAAGAAERALQLDPVSPLCRAAAAQVPWFERQYDDAVDQLRKALEVDPEHPALLWILGIMCIDSGHHEDGIAALKRAVVLSPSTQFSASLGYAYALAGRRAEALQILGELTSRSTREYVAPDALARICIGIGDTDRAFTWLDRGYEDHSGWMAYLAVDPSFDLLRSDPRFLALLRRMNLPDTVASVPSSDSPTSGCLRR